MEKILNHTNRMNAIIDDLLKLSKIDLKKKMTAFFARTGFVSILLGAKQDMENSSPNVLNSIEIICNDDVLVKGDSQLLREAF